MKYMLREKIQSKLPEDQYHFIWKRSQIWIKPKNFLLKPFSLDTFAWIGYYATYLLYKIDIESDSSG